ncbi:SAFB [Bugula neritina]|uniref:SAFB n=1 Tax=Bugula neritina TaxID=10212 RepID=A0A7J7J1X8_BUGNE|nr:SAFB [Bugula neritina]
MLMNPDTNLDYDLGDKAEERDAPTPTKDESMDVDASDIVQSEEHSASAAVTATSQAEKSEATSSTPTSATKSLSDVRVDVPKRDSKDLAASQNLWISNLSSLTRATDLKAVFSKHGKVIGAKVVTNANRPGAKCYGYVTMSSPEEAAKCIQNLHRTELHGRMISVEKAKSDPAAQARAATIRKPVGTDDKKKEDSVAASAPKDETTSVDHKDDAGATDEVNGPTSTDDKTRVSDRLRPVRPPITGPGRKEGESEVRDGSQKPVDKPRKSTPERKAEEALDREKRRLKLQERRARDDDYRRRTALLKEKRMLADQQRNLRMEETRMAREREKLRLDREKCKIEEMKLEGLHQERTRLENLLDDLRQRVDREREELKRVETLRLEEIRRSSSLKRPYEGSGGRSSGGSGRYDDAGKASVPLLTKGTQLAPWTEGGQPM